MSTVKADTVQPKDSGTDITLGAAGDTVTVAANSINVNKVQDKGGNTLWDYSTGVFVSSKKEFASQNLKLLSTQTASSSASVSFRTGIDSTYDVYCFKFIDINVSAYCNFQFNGSSNSGSNYNVTKTTTYFGAENYENNASSTLNYRAGNDLAQSTAYQMMFQGADNGADDACVGELWLYAPSSTTYVKNFLCSGNYKVQASTGASTNFFVGGYFNTTSAINAFNFNTTSGTFDGTIKLYGISKS